MRDEDPESAFILQPSSFNLSSALPFVFLIFVFVIQPAQPVPEFRLAPSEQDAPELREDPCAPLLV